MAQKRAAYDGSGNITGFYDDVESPVPAGVNAIQITDSQWQQALTTSGYTVQGGALTAPLALTPEQQLTGAQRSQISALRSAATAAMTNGFSSSAIGSPYTYPSTALDLQTLNDAVTDAKASGQAASLWCQDASGQWADLSHTAAQIQQVKQDYKTFRTANQQELATLVAQVKAATSVTTVQTIVWT